MKTANKAKEALIKVIEKVEALSQHAAEVEKMIADHKPVELTVHKAREYAESIADIVRQPLIILDADLRVITANRSFYQTFKVTSRPIPSLPLTCPKLWLITSNYSRSFLTSLLMPNIL